MKDKFAINILNPTVLGGREYYCTWENGISRNLNPVQNDPQDPEGIARGDGNFRIDGNGLLAVAGDHPRFYVYDRNKRLRWNNVEMTCYCKRISERKGSIHDFRLAARTNHQDIEKCNSHGQGYLLEFNYKGRIQFRKEIFHNLYANPEPHELEKKNWWGTSKKELPKNSWIGMKFVLRTCHDGKHVNLQGYRDMTDGENGGDWGNSPLIEYLDQGNWTSEEITTDILNECAENRDCEDRLGEKRDPIILRPGISCYLRTDFVNEASFKKLSIREIEPLD